MLNKTKQFVKEHKTEIIMGLAFTGMGFIGLEIFKQQKQIKNLKEAVKEICEIERHQLEREITRIEEEIADIIAEAVVEEIQE